MAKIDKTALTDWNNGDTVKEDGLEKDFEVLRVALNATDDEVKSNKTYSDGVASRVLTLESKYGSGVASAIQEYTWTPTEGQTVFTLPSGQTYAAGYIDVIVGGVLQTDVIESSGTTFTLAEGVPAGVTEVYAKWFQGVALASSLVPSITDMPGYSTNVDDRIGILSDIKANSTTEEKTWHVNPNTGDDITGDGSITTPFKTVQKAWDSIPTIVLHEQTILLADGTYNVNEQQNMPRPSVLLARGKFITHRTYESGNATVGFITIKGTSKTGTIIETTDSLPYGIYVAQGQLALSTMTIRGRSSGTNATSLLVAHRSGVYIQLDEVILDGVSASKTNYGAYAEAGGWIEFTQNCIVRNCANGLVPFELSGMTFANTSTVENNCTNGVINRGTFIMANTSSANSPFVNYGLLKTDGTSGASRVSFGGTIDSYGGSIKSTWTNFENLINLYNAKLDFDTCAWQRQINALYSTVMLRSSTSYTSGNTSNTDVKPLTLNNSEYLDRGSNTIKGSGNSVQDYNVILPSVSADGTVINVTPSWNVVHLSGGSALRLNCTLGATNIPDGKTIRLVGTSWGVQLVNGTTSDIGGGSITLGNSTGQYIGIELVFYNGKWREVSRSAVRS